jgi:bifunctional pyridoxal-dependent enzyme with beta-cystathionase and maltose regulon repressor activities
MSRFDQIISRTGTSSVRLDKYPEGVIPLWVADMDFSVPECVSEALSARIAHPIYGYTYASHTLREAIQEYLNKEYDYSIEKEWLVFIPSVVSGLHMVARNLLEDTHHALIPRPAYHHFQMAMEGVNRSYSYYTFDEVDNRWTLNYDYFKKVFSPIHD